MATLIPARSTCLPRMTGGEKRFSQRLEDKLEDDYLIWYDVKVGPKQRQPDFIVLHPRRGLLLLEVKDWKLDTLHAIDRHTATLRTERGLVKQLNPLLQARDVLLELVTTLQKDPALVHRADHAHAGKLILPWGYGAVLTNISRAAFEANELGDALPEHLVVCQDEMLESADAEAFQQRLWNMFNYHFGDALTLPQIDRIRWHLFPEVRVRPPLQPDLLDAAAPSSATSVVPIPDIVRVMDFQQEQLARSLGDGHRVIHGVAGSGKTMILGYRCLHLARSQDKPIAVLCFNRALAARLAQVIDAQALQARVDVRSFHSWCKQMLVTYHVPEPPKTTDAEAYFAAQVQAVIRGVECGLIPRAQYGAVLIDEGHDFQPDWFKLVVQMVDPETKSLLLLYDDAQSIYGAARRGFSFASVGIEARGRTTVLRLNYRNTYEVLAVARAFARDLFDQGEGGDEDAPNAIAPESVGRHGPALQLVRCTSLNAEADAIATLIDDARNDGVRLEQMAVLWRHGYQGDAVGRALKQRGVPYLMANNSTGKDRLFTGEPSVKLVSLHSSKGLEFERVFIPALHSFPGARDEPAAEAKLLYVAMTRATERLVMTCSAETGFVERIDGAVRAMTETQRSA